MKGNLIDDKQLKVLVKDWKENKHMKALIISSNKITHKGFDYLLRKLSCHEKLHIIDISDNQLGNTALSII